MARVTQMSGAMNLRNFIRSVEDFEKDVVLPNFLNLHAEVAVEAFRRIVRRTPVKTGWAVFNWQMRVGKIPKSVGDRRSYMKRRVPYAPANMPKRPNVSKRMRQKVARARLLKRTSATALKNEVIRRGIQEIRGQLKLGSRVLIANYVPYIYLLETPGYSNQAPQGIVKITLEELRITRKFR